MHDQIGPRSVNAKRASWVPVGAHRLGFRNQRCAPLFSLQ